VVSRVLHDRPSAAARAVLAEGSEISKNLRELAASLRNNAERLLRDVRLTHGAMTAQLDQVAPSERAALEREAGESGRRGRERGGGGGESGEDLDVPEFIPRH